MNKDRLLELLGELQDEATELEQRLSGVRKLITGYTEVYPELAAEVRIGTGTSGLGDTAEDAPGEQIPKGQEAVKQVLYGSEGEWFTVTRMANELRRRGWLGDASGAGGAVRAALRRAQEADPRIFRDRGAKTGALTYSFRPFEPHDPSGLVADKQVTDSGAQDSGH